MKSLFITFRRLIAFGTFLAFSISSAGGAYSGTVPLQASLGKSQSLGNEVKLPFQMPFHLPPELGVLRRYSPARPGNPFLIYIQDAHAIPAAQAKIRDILKWFETQAGGAPMWIGLEGAKGELHPEYLDFFKDYPSINEAVVQNLAAQGELTGAELFAWERYRQCKQPSHCDSSAVFRGVENSGLYRRNLRDYRFMLFRQDKINKLLGPLRLQLGPAQSRILSAPVREFLEERKRRKEGEYQTQFNFPQWESYLRFLSASAKKELGIDLADPVEQIRFPNLTRLAAIGHLKASFDPGRAEEEKKKLITALWEKEIPLNPGKRTISALRHRLETLEAQPDPRRVLEEAWSFAQSKGIPLKSFPEFLKSAGQIILGSEIEADELAGEFDRLEKWLLNRLAKRPEEKRLIRLLDDFRLLERLLHLKLTRKDWARVLKRRYRISPYVLQRRVQVFVPDFTSFEDAATARFFRLALRFYADARRRDRVLLENALKAARTSVPPQFIVLIAGGFHSEGLTARMKQKGVGYAVVAPKFDDPGSEGFQARVFRDENARLPYLKNPPLNKQEAIFLKQILETAAPKLVEIRSFSNAQIGIEISRVINRHSVLFRRIRAATRYFSDLSSILLGIAPVKYTPGYPNRLNFGVNTVGDALLLQVRQDFDDLRPLQPRISSAISSEDFSIPLKSSGLRLTVRNVRRLVRSVPERNKISEVRSEARSDDEQANVRERFPELFSETSNRRRELVKKFDYSPKGVRAAKIPAEPDSLQQEAGFAILPGRDSIFRRRVQNYSERLARGIQNPKDKLYPHDEYRVALVARYSDEDQAPRLSAEVLKRASEIAKEKLDAAGIRQFSVPVTGIRDTTDGSIVLDIEKNKSLFDLRTLLFEALVQAVEEDRIRRAQGVPLDVRERKLIRNQFRTVLDQDRNTSLRGVVTVARAIPNPQKPGTLLTDRDLAYVDKERVVINHQLKIRPLIIPVQEIYLVEPSAEYLEEMKAPPVPVPLKPHEANSPAAEEAAKEVYRMFKEDIQKDGFLNSGATLNFQKELFEKEGTVWQRAQALGTSMETVLIPLKRQLHAQALKWEQGTEAEEVPKWQRFFWSARIHGILWLMNSYYPHLSGKAEETLEEEETALQRHFESFVNYILMHYRIAFHYEKGKPVPVKGFKFSTFMRTKPGTGLEGSGILAAASMTAWIILLLHPELDEVFVHDPLRLQVSSAIGSDGFARGLLHLITILHGAFYLKGQPPVVVQVQRVREGEEQKLTLRSVDLNKEEEFEKELSLTKNGDDPLFYLEMAYRISRGISETGEDTPLTHSLWGAILEGLTGVRGMINSLAAIHGQGFLFTTNSERSYNPTVQVVVPPGKRLKDLQEQMRLLNIGFKKPRAGAGSTMGGLANRALLFLINDPKMLVLMQDARDVTRKMVGSLQADPVDTTQLVDAINNVQLRTNEAIQDDTPEPLRTFLNKIRQKYEEKTKKPLAILVQGAGPGGAVLLYGERMDIADQIKKELIGDYIKDLKEFGLYDEENPPDFFDFQLTEQGQNVLRPVQKNPVFLEGETLRDFLKYPAGEIRKTIKGLGFRLKGAPELKAKVKLWHESKQNPGKISFRLLQSLNEEQNIQVHLDDLSGRSLGDFFPLRIRLLKRSELRFPVATSPAKEKVFDVQPAANLFRSQLFLRKPSSSPELLRNFSEAQIQGRTGRLRWNDFSRRYPGAATIREVSEAATRSLYGDSLWKDLPEPAAWRFLQLALVADNLEDRSNPILNLIHQILGEYAPLLLNPGKTPIHLIFPLSKNELPPGALAFLALAQGNNDRLSFILPADPAEAKRLERAFKKEAIERFRLPKKSGEILRVVGASANDLRRAVKNLAGGDPERAVGILNESITFLEALGYIRGKERLYAEGLDEDSAILLAAALLRNRFADDPYSIKNIRSELRSRNIDVSAFVARVGNLIEAFRRFTASA